MSLRPPSQYTLSALTGPGAAAISAIDTEVAAEKASSLGRAGERVEQSLRRLSAIDPSDPDRPKALKSAAAAVYAYFIQRELCGLRRHEQAIRDYAIPQEVLVRLGAS
jgi:hypothetical protein